MKDHLPDIIATVEKEGGQFKRKGNRLWALSPFRNEKNSSFMVDPDRQRWFDFGIGKGGDVIDFIKELKGLSFKEALSYLGINGKPYRPDPKEIRKRELLQQFRLWCNDYYSDLCSLLRCLWKAKQQVKDEADLKKLVPFYHQESAWLYQVAILQGSDDQAKFELYKEVAHGN